MGLGLQGDGLASQGLTKIRISAFTGEAAGHLVEEKKGQSDHLKN